MTLQDLPRRFFSSPLPLVAVVLASLVLVFHRSQTRQIDPDEIEALHSGWMVLAGERPYADFVQQHHPAHYWLLAGVMGITGEGSAAILACRGLHYAFFLGTLAMVWLLARELFGRERGRWAGLYALALLGTSAVYGNRIIDVRPDVPMLLTGLIAIWAFLRHGRDRRHRFLVIGGLSLGLSFLFLQKAMFLMLALLVLSALRLARGRMNLREVGVAVGALAAVLLPFYGYLLASGDFALYYTANWKVNADGQGGFGPAFWLIKNFGYSTVLWSFAGVGVLFFMKEPRERELAFITLVLLASLWVMKRPWMYYSLPMLPLLALIAGRALSEAFEEKRFLAHVTVLLGAVPGLYYLKAIPYPWNGHSLKMIELARTETPEGARVHDGDNLFNVFRKPLDFYWYSLGENGVMERFEKVIPRGYDRDALFREHRPRVVATAELQHVDPSIAARYARSTLDTRISLLVESYEVADADLAESDPPSSSD